MHRSARTWFVLAAAISPAASAQTFVTDASLAGTAFNPGVRGQAVPAVTIDRGDYITGIPKALAVSRGSSLRGVAGGLEADTFNWKNNNNSYRAGTLDYLRYSRDYDADLYITANIRGLVQPDPNSPGDQRFYDTSIPTLASIAGDWVRYTNRIAQTYRQGQTVTDTRDAAILNSLAWNKSATAGDSFDKLLAPGEAAVPKVKYWEIGNEPRVGLSSSYRVTNSYTFLAPPRLPDATHKTDFTQRYAALTSAMLAEDPTIQVGPALQWLSSASEQEILTDLLRRQSDGTFLPVHFLGYHPYQKLNEQTTPLSQEAFLRTVYDDHASKINGIRNIVSAAGRDPNSIKLVASEHNVSNWSSNDQLPEMTMAHALGNTETVFSFARLGVQAAHYWIWPAHRWDGTEYPMYLASQKLQDHMGDTLLGVSAASADNLHLYTTRDSASGEIAMWGLNFDDDTAITRATPIQHVGGRGAVTLYTLGALSGATSLASANLSTEMAGGPTHAVDWKTVDLTGQRLDNLSLTFGSATITLLTIQPWRQLSLPGDVNRDGAVDSADATAVSTNNNTDERNWQQGDVTGDGLVNAADAALVSANTGVALNKRWNRSAGGSWTTSSNWSPTGIPNAIGANAYLAGVITAPRSVTLNTTVRLGTLAFDNAFAYDLAQSSTSGVLRMENTGTANARVYVIQGSHRISTPLTLASSTIVDVADRAGLLTAGTLTANSGKTLTKTGAGTLTIAGPQSYASPATLTVSGGTVQMSTNAGSTSAANLTVNANAAVSFASKQNLAALNIGAPGIATLAPPGASSNTLVTRALTVAPGGRVDLTTNAMVVDGGNFTAVEALIARGFHGGDWLGDGVSSSAAAADPAFRTAVAVVSNDLSVSTNGRFTGAYLTTFAGVPVDTNDVLVKYTWYGDADLNGSVDGTDYGLIDAGFLSGGSLKGWFNGDFDYSGRIDGTDYGLIDGAFLTQDGSTLGTPAADALLAAREAQFGQGYVASLVASVPEPAGFGALALASLAVRRRRPQRGPQPV
jgi:autotransporter-associated beta strand protein